MAPIHMGGRTRRRNRESRRGGRGRKKKHLTVDELGVEGEVVELQRAAAKLDVELVEVEVAEDQIPKPLLEQRLADALQQRVETEAVQEPHRFPFRGGVGVGVGGQRGGGGSPATEAIVAWFD